MHLWFDALLKGTSENALFPILFRSLVVMNIYIIIGLDRRIGVSVHTLPSYQRADVYCIISSSILIAGVIVVRLARGDTWRSSLCRVALIWVCTADKEATLDLYIHLCIASSLYDDSLDRFALTSGLIQWVKIFAIWYPGCASCGPIKHEPRWSICLHWHVNVFLPVLDSG